MSERDGWCTPKWLTDLLPHTGLDPCSNERSTVNARGVLEGNGDHDNGLTHPWANTSVFCNPPYSNVLPWAEKAAEATAFIFLVNLDPSTKWWRALEKSGAEYIFLFNKRIQFVPPPGVKASTNPKPQVLVCNRSGYFLVDSEALDAHGRWWTIP